MHVNSWETGRTHHLSKRLSTSRHLAGKRKCWNFLSLGDYLWKFIFLWDEVIPLHTYEGTVKRILILLWEVPKKIPWKRGKSIPQVVLKTLKILSQSEWLCFCKDKNRVYMRTILTQQNIFEKKQENKRLCKINVNKTL